MHYGICEMRLLKTGITFAQCGHDSVHHLIQSWHITETIGVLLCRAGHQTIKLSLIPTWQPHANAKHVDTTFLGMVGQRLGELGEDQTTRDEDGEVGYLRAITVFQREYLWEMTGNV